jgi:hypothetical protein
MLAFLKSTRRSLVLLVKAQKYLKSDDYSSAQPRKRRRKTQKSGEREIPFRTQTLIAVIAPGGRLRAMRRLPKRIRDAINNMPESNRHEFGHRFVAIARADLGMHRTKKS